MVSFDLLFRDKRASRVVSPYYYIYTLCMQLIFKVILCRDQVYKFTSIIIHFTAYMLDSFCGVGQSCTMWTKIVLYMYTCIY
jgi:hypothetical protein